MMQRKEGEGGRQRDRRHEGGRRVEWMEPGEKAEELLPLLLLLLVQAEERGGRWTKRTDGWTDEGMNEWMESRSVATTACSDDSCACLCTQQCSTKRAQGSQPGQARRGRVRKELHRASERAERGEERERLGRAVPARQLASLVTLV